MSGHYILRKFVMALLTIGVSSFLSFILLRSMPGDRKTFLRVDKVEVEGKVLPEDPE